MECGSKPVGRKHPAQVNSVYKRHPGLFILNSDKERSKKGFSEQNAIEKKSLVKHKEIFYSLIQVSDSRSHLHRIGKTLDFNIKIEVFYLRDAELAFYAKYCVPFMAKPLSSLSK